MFSSVRTVIVHCVFAMLSTSVLIGCSSPSRHATLPPFPGAQGWAAHTPGGRGGQILRVTNLAASGPGSLLEAVETRGPRIIVFEVGGLIDLDRRSIHIREPFITIAGHTAPNPGITLIRGGLQVNTHDVVIRHVRVRTGEAGAAKKSGWEVDALSTGAGARDVIIDHCSLSWGTDETLSAAGPRFHGRSPDEWRRNTSHRITFSHNIIGETLANSTHSGGHHSRGMLIHDNVTDVLIVGNLFAHNTVRNPAFKGGSRGSVINNLIYNPGSQAAGYILLAAEWGDRPHQKGRIDVIGNVLRAGPSSTPHLGFFSYRGAGDLDLHMSDNITFDRAGQVQRTIMLLTPEAKQLTLAEHALHPLDELPLSSSAVEDSVVRNAGARPWARDDTDRRIIATVTDRIGGFIDSEQDVGGYPAHVETRQPFDPSCWDMQFLIPRPPAETRSATVAPCATPPPP